MVRLTSSAQEFKYDVALSYASEDSQYVDQVASYLKEKSIKVFYDRYEELELWGKDLVEELEEVFAHNAMCCVVFISQHYRDKMWTTHERRSALSRALEERREYILPARFDNTEIPGIPKTIKYLDLENRTPRQFAQLIVSKLDRLATREKLRENGGRDGIPRIDTTAFRRRVAAWARKALEGSVSTGELVYGLKSRNPYLVDVHVRWGGWISQTDTWLRCVVRDRTIEVEDIRNLVRKMKDVEAASAEGHLDFYFEHGGIVSTAVFSRNSLSLATKHDIACVRYASRRYTLLNEVSWMEE